MKYLITLVILIAAVFLIKTNNTIYEQGEWNSISYKVADGSNKKTISRIKILKSKSIQLEDRIRLLVYFKVENTEDNPSSFGWNNKYIITEDGISFSPIRGEGVNNLQPYTTSNKLFVEYKLPIYIDIKKIYWGLYDGPSQSMRYKIHLNPTESIVNEMDDPKKITFEELQNNYKKLIGRKVKLTCWGTQFMLISPGGNTFNARCQEGNPYIVNYEIGFIFKDEMLPIINKIKSKSLKFHISGKVEWPEPTNFMSKIIIVVESIQIDK